MAEPEIIEKLWERIEQKLVELVEQKLVPVIRTTLNDWLRKEGEPLARLPSAVPRRTLWTARSPEELPPHLKTTYDAVRTLLRSRQGEEATGVRAEEVAEYTGRSISCESSYMSLLARRGFLRKERRGKYVLYTIPDEGAVEKTQS